MRLSTVLRWLLLVSFPVWVVLYVAMLASWRFAAGIQIAGTLAFWLFVCGFAALPCAVCFERGRRRAIMMSGIVAASASFVLGVGLTVAVAWLGPEVVQRIARVTAPIHVWAGWCAILAMLLVSRTKSVLAIWLRFITVTLATMLGLLIVGWIWFEGFLDTYLIVTDRLVGALALLTGVGAASTLLAIRVRFMEPEGAAHEREDVVRLPLTVKCPRCDVRQMFQTGGATCSRCGLAIRILVP